LFSLQIGERRGVERIREEDVISKKRREECDLMRLNE
jgi:hypothetical protein